MDVIAFGLREETRMVSTVRYASSYISVCSDEFIDIFNKSDIIISKGQGNYEALSEENSDIFSC
jgi:uncharacterized protein with ATP-grasp and redox domains